jgi:hypothetical protein
VERTERLALIAAAAMLDVVEGEYRFEARRLFDRFEVDPMCHRQFQSLVVSDDRLPTP